MTPVFTYIHTNIAYFFMEPSGDSSSIITTKTNTEKKTEKQIALCIATYASLLLVIAIIGFLSQGYHVAFLPINALGEHIPKFLLHTITSFGNGMFLLAIALALGHKNPRFLFAVLIAAILGGITSNVLKSHFNALRPPAIIIESAFHLADNAFKYDSFPSGHTLTAFLFASICSCFLKRIWATFALLAMATLVGLTRIGLGIHWPIDTLIGGMLGCIIGLGAYALSKKLFTFYGIKMYIFTTCIFVTACLLLLTQKNDYTLAQPMLSMIALSAVILFIKSICIHPQRSISEYIYSLFAHKGAYIFYTFLIIITVYRILVISQPHLALFYDEAYYYHWSLNPDFGYYSKPPMVAWAILFSTSLIGDNIFGLKIMASIFYAASAVCIFNLTAYLTRHSQSLEHACMAGLIFLSVPIVSFNSEFITTDAPLFFFWSLTLYLFILALDQNTLRLWIYTGIAVGMGMLSKYTMAPLPVALFLFLLCTKNQRHYLTAYGPWLGAMVAALIFSVNIYWNMQHDWIALQHTQDISKTHNTTLKPLSLLSFLLTQFFVFGPIWTWYLLSMIKQAWITKKPTTAIAPTKTMVKPEIYSLLLFVTLAMLIVIGLQALLSRALANWAGPWVIGATILLAISLPMRQLFTTKILIRGLTIHILLAATFYHWPYVLQALHIEPTRNNDPYQRVLGWEAMGDALKPTIARYPEHTLASDSRDLLAYLGYYSKPGSYNFARWNPDASDIRDYYDLTVNLKKWQGDLHHAFIYISRQPVATHIKQQFNDTHFLTKITVPVYEKFFREIYVYEFTGFKGYE